MEPLLVVDALDEIRDAVPCFGQVGPVAKINLRVQARLRSCLSVFMKLSALALSYGLPARRKRACTRSC